MYLHTPSDKIAFYAKNNEPKEKEKDSGFSPSPFAFQEVLTDNQTKRGCELARERVSADCSLAARIKRAECEAPNGNVCATKEYWKNKRTRGVNPESFCFSEVFADAKVKLCRAQ